MADYRESVLVAFQNVEDSLSSLRYLAQQQAAEDRAYTAYQAALDLTNSRYTTGLVSYFDVIQAQGLALGAEQTDVQIKGNRIATTVQLIKALGGGWADSYIVKPDLSATMSPLRLPSPRSSTRAQAVPCRRRIRNGRLGDVIRAHSHF